LVLVLINVLECAATKSTIHNERFIFLRNLRLTRAKN
jgi:hypothetical protein